MRHWAMIMIGIILAAIGTQPANGQSMPDFWDGRQSLSRPELEIPRLRFLTSVDFFPFNFVDAEGRLTGFHLDLARALCEELDLLDRCQIQALPFDELDAALEEGDGEALIAGLSITSKTREEFLFTRPYFQFPARFVTKKTAGLTEPMHRAIAEKSVGVLANTAHEQMLRDFFPQAKAVSYPDLDALLSDLLAGKIDAVFGDGMRLSFWFAEEGNSCCIFAGGPYWAPEYLGPGLAIAVRRDLPELVTAIDFALQEIRLKGTFEELYLRYFPVQFY